MSKYDKIYDRNYFPARETDMERKVIFSEKQSSPFLCNYTLA